MKSKLLCAIITSALCSLGTLYGQNLTESVPTLQTVLKFKPGQSIVYQPVRLQVGQSLDITHIRFGDGSVKPGEKRAVQLVIYSAQADQAGQHEALFQDTYEIVRGAPAVHSFATFQGTDETSRKGIIAVLIGLLLPANEANPARPTLLPTKDSLTAEIHGTGIGLLLPAVQKVREAAAR